MVTHGRELIAICTDADARERSRADLRTQRKLAGQLGGPAHNVVGPLTAARICGLLEESREDKAGVIGPPGPALRHGRSRPVGELTLA